MKMRENDKLGSSHATSVYYRIFLTCEAGEDKEVILEEFMKNIFLIICIYHIFFFTSSHVSIVSSC